MLLLCRREFLQQKLICTIISFFSFELARYFFMPMQYQTLHNRKLEQL